jgi:hypothetical protein
MSPNSASATGANHARLTRNFASEVVCWCRYSLRHRGVAKRFGLDQLRGLRLGNRAVLLVAGKIGAVGGEQAFVLSNISSARIRDSGGSRWSGTGGEIAQPGRP